MEWLLAIQNIELYMFNRRWVEGASLVLIGHRGLKGHGGG
jgi:hypothetical protein